MTKELLEERKRIYREIERKKNYETNGHSYEHNVKMYEEREKLKKKMLL